MTGGVVGCVAISYLAEPARAELWHVAVVAFAAFAFFVRGRSIRIRTEVFAVWTVVPIAFVISHPGAPMEGAFFVTVLMVFSVAATDRNRVRTWVVTGVSAAVPPLVSQWLGSPEGIGWVAWTMAHLFTFVLGRVVHELSEAIRALDGSRSALAEQAVLEERRRIARELHDLAGHTLAAVMLHVTGARHVLARDPAEADRALADAEDVGRQSLDQIRSTVSALRTTERGTDPSVAGLSDLADLVEQYRSAGLTVHMELAVEAAAVDLAVGVALHRIVREALANVARHAPGNDVTVTVAGLGDTGATVDIIDVGAAARPVDRGTAHFGITGMTERARALGGVLEAGPTNSGWRVRADLPAPGYAGDPDPVRIPRV